MEKVLRELTGLNELKNVDQGKRSEHTNAKSIFKAGCLFAGIGSFARALHTSGVEVCWANEKDPYAVKTFEYNFPHVRVFPKPVEQLSVVKDNLQPVDILTAGFPCQPFSIAGSQAGLKDERGQLFLHIIRLIEEFGDEKPKILLLENVKNFRTHDKGRTFEIVKSKVQEAGYWFSNKDAAILNTMTHTSIPQNRERIFLAAFSMDYFPCNTFRFPEPLLAGNMKKVEDFLDLDEKAPDIFYFKPGDRYFPHFNEAISNGNAGSVYQLRRSYVRENKSGVCFTLMAVMGEGGHHEPVIKDPWGIRKLTPKEIARLQGFNDDWFKIPQNMSKSRLGKQLGNTITVPLAELLTNECVAQLEQREIQLNS